MKRDLNELYAMVCTDRNEYLQAVQAVVTFSGLHGEELQGVLPKLQGPQPEPTLNDIRGYTPYYERDDIIMGGGESPDIIADYPDFFDPIMPDSETFLSQEVFNLDAFSGEQVDVSDVTFTEFEEDDIVRSKLVKEYIISKFGNTEFQIL